METKSEIKDKIYVFKELFNYKFRYVHVKVASYPGYEANVKATTNYFLVSCPVTQLHAGGTLLITST